MSHHHILGEEQINALSFFARLILLDVVIENAERFRWNR